jgi:hypothetical protein
LHKPVIAVSLNGLGRKVRAMMLPDDVEVILRLDRNAKIERDRRRRPEAA